MATNFAIPSLAKDVVNRLKKDPNRRPIRCSLALTKHILIQYPEVTITDDIFNLGTYATKSKSIGAGVYEIYLEQLK